MTIITIILIYAIGVLFAYGRARASFNEFVQDDFIIIKNKAYKSIVFYSLLSWMGFAAGTLVYFFDREWNECKFLKFES